MSLKRNITIPPISGEPEVELEFIQILEFAERRRRLGDVAVAEACCRDILAAEPDHAEAIHLLGELRHQQQDSDDAAELIGRAIEIDPNNAAFHKSLAIVFEALGQNDKAMQHYRDAADLSICSGTESRENTAMSEGQNNIRKQLADLYSGFGQLDDAEKIRESRDQSDSPAWPANARSTVENGWIFRIPPIIRLLRPHQWIKNAFVASPLLLTPALLTSQSVTIIAMGVACFCALSSTAYVVNDFIDREADREHPTKRHRPLAAGTISPTLAFIVAGLLGVGGLAGAYALAPMFCVAAAGYLGLNFAYSFGLKNTSILDVIIVALGFVLRVEAGALLAGVTPSAWIIICTGLLGLFLAIAKRRNDVIHTVGKGRRKYLDGYNKNFLDNCLSISLGALLVCYTIYTTDSAVAR